MIERIVVPLDGSMTAEAILPQVRRVLYRNDSEIILVRALPTPLVEEAAVLAEVQLGAAREYVMGQVEKLQRQGVRVRHVLRMGSPVEVILDVVESEKATLIALATHGKTGLQRFLLGSVAEALLRRSPVPVLLVRPFWSYDLTPPKGAELRPVRSILLPVDGSGLARQALPGLLEFASLFEARIVLLRILAGADSRVVEAPENSKARAELEDLAQAIEKRGVETLRLLGTGDPVPRILETVREQSIDVIAMTTHGRRGLSRMKHGSLTEEVLRKAEVPLLVTRSKSPVGGLAKPPVKGGVYA